MENGRSYLFKKHWNVSKTSVSYIKSSGLYVCEDLSYILQFQPPGVQISGQPPPKDHMTPAVFVTFCCFFPIGVFAIWRASKVSNKYN